MVRSGAYNPLLRVLGGGRSPLSGLWGGGATVGAELGWEPAVAWEGEMRRGAGRLLAFSTPPPGSGLAVNLGIGRDWAGSGRRGTFGNP